MMKRIIVLLLLCLIPIIGTSQEKGKVEYTLEQCLEIALTKNYNLKIAQSNVVSSSADVTSAFGDFLPTIDGNMSYRRTLSFGKLNIDGVPFEIPTQIPNSYSATLSANLNIFNGFSKEKNYARAQSYYTSDLLQSQYMEKVVIYDVYSNFIEVIRKNRIIEVRRENLATGKKELERINAQYKAGIVPINNVYTQETDNGNREYQLVLAINEFKFAKTSLMKVLGMNPNLGTKFVDTDLPNDVDQDKINNFRKEIGTVDNAIQYSYDNRLDLEREENRVEAADDYITIANSGYYPSLNAFGAWSWNNNEFNNFNEYSSTYVGLSLRIPILNNLNTTASSQKAKISYDKVVYNKNILEQNITQEVIQSLNNLDASEKNLEITQKSLKSANMNYRSFDERYKVGTASITDKIVANSQFLQAQINRINAIYSYFLAQKQVQFSIGKL
jgi:outer membrane protein